MMFLSYFKFYGSPYLSHLYSNMLIYTHLYVCYASLAKFGSDLSASNGIIAKRNLQRIGTYV